MTTDRTPRRGTSKTGGSELSPEHYLLLIIHRKWWVLATFVVVTAITIALSLGMPDIFTSYTLILVDPQKVPESYVKSTVTGDVRNRLGTLSQQILSATRLQKIIETLNLYPELRKSQAREEGIGRIRADISVQVVGDFGASQDLQAFRIKYSGQEPRLVAQVTNQLASLFIEENLKAREQQATGTTEFLQNQLLETRKVLEAQEAKLRDFKLKHIGEMPEHQTANLQVLGQLQSQLQIEGDALARAEQQKSYIQSMMTQTAPVVELDDPNTPSGQAPGKAGNTAKSSAPSKSTLAGNKANLASLLSRYTEKRPEVRRLQKEIEEEEAKAKNAQAKQEEEKATVAESAPAPAPAPTPIQRKPLTAKPPVNV